MFDVLPLFYFRPMNRLGKLILLVASVTVTASGMFLNAQPPNTITPQPVKAKLKEKSGFTASGTNKDSLANKQVNMVAGLPKKDSAITTQADLWQLYTNSAGTTRQDDWLINKPVQRPSPNYVFYLLAGLFLVLGFIRSMFSKYFSDLFGLFFRVTFKQKAVRERLFESALPSMLMNGLFFVSGGFFLYAISGYYQWNTTGNFWYGVGFWIMVLVIIYGVKWLLLKIMGWLFQVQETSNTYSFIVFLVNKVLGVLLLPVVVLMTMGPYSLHPALVTVVLFLLGSLFIYRYIISYPSIKATIRVNQFHFFLYLCAFEIVPLLIIYKVLALRLSSVT